MGEWIITVFFILCWVGFLFGVIYGVLWGICKLFKLKPVKKVLITLTIILEGFVLFGMATNYVRRGTRSRLRRATDDIGDQFDPGVSYNHDKQDGDNDRQVEVLNSLRAEGLVEEDIKK